MSANCARRAAGFQRDGRCLQHQFAPMMLKTLVVEVATPASEDDKATSPLVHGQRSVARRNTAFPRETGFFWSSAISSCLSASLGHRPGLNA